MEPVVFSGHAGWLHAAHGERAVVLCNPLGHEAMWLHHAMHQFAHYLASRGISVLRFDYLGTGDSADTGDWVRPLDWVAEVVDAVTWLKRTTSAKHISLAGFRLGATIAALAARQTEVESIVMFAPVVSARLFLRELSILHQTWSRQAGLEENSPPTPQDAREIFGHRFSAHGLEALGEIDLCAAPRSSASRVLIAHNRQHDGCDALAAQLEAQGVRVESIEFPEYAQTLRPPWLSESPVTMLHAAVDWLSMKNGNGAESSREHPLSHTRTRISVPGATEHTVIADNGRLPGILCEPVQQRAPAAPALLIANTAATHHVGDGRFGVELAREMAWHGYTSLRVDANGMGDSEGAAQVRIPGHVTFDSIASDLSLWVDWLAARGYRHVVIFGICAGAYAALNAARDNPVLRGLVLVNPASFYLPQGCTIQQAARRPRGSPRANLRSMMCAEKWLQVIRGEVRLGPVAHTLWRHAVARLQSLLSLWSNDMLFTTTSSYQVHRIFRRLDAAGVRVQLLFSPRDHALDEFYMHFGIGRRRIKSLARMNALVLHNVDHEVLNRRAREEVTAACLALLQEICLSEHSENARTLAPGRRTELAHPASLTSLASSGVSSADTLTVGGTIAPELSIPKK
ncbi:serine aminopeptidase domain-containing protein [Burkholderia ubonensis]|uniref:alpha/beta hydrolase n=1 Tax=Burkholderia ubonensis TaxID=101571 RepID=UPI0009B4C8E0|nr:alpha/beta hydrolase [Burkholderia ubonensis]